MLEGKVIKYLRQAKSLTQKEVAKKAGMCSVGLCDLENGRNVGTLGNIKKLVKVLGLKYTEFWAIIETVENSKKANKILKEELSIIEFLKIIKMK
jgi:transcriptional regulator with XRE-family HTH domain